MSVNVLFHMIPLSHNSWKLWKWLFWTHFIKAKMRLMSEQFVLMPKTHFDFYKMALEMPLFKVIRQFLSLSFKNKFLSCLQWESLLLTSFMIMMTGGSPLISSSEKEQKWDVSRPITALLTVTDDVWEEARESEKNKELTKKNKLD